MCTIGPVYYQVWSPVIGHDLVLARVDPAQTSRAREQKILICLPDRTSEFNVRYISLYWPLNDHRHPGEHVHRMSTYERGKIGHGTVLVQAFFFSFSLSLSLSLFFAGRVLR